MKKTEAGTLIGKKISPAEAMRLAVREGARGMGHVAPNPLVGCAIVDRNHKLLAVSHHAKLGQDHAEIAALKKIKDKSKLKGAHLYVTLEPCAHEGRTPSCAKTLAPLKPASITFAVEDPNPLVAGKGAAILREAGIKAELLSAHKGFSKPEREELTAQAEDLAEIFLHNQRTNEPFFAVKIATSLDGQMAHSGGESRWITGERARLHAHTVRARYDAVMVGAGTLLYDNPSLNIRHPRFKDIVNRAIVLDPVGKTLASMKSSNLIQVRPPKNVFVVTAPGVSVPAGFPATHLECETAISGEFNIDNLITLFKDQGLTSVMIEGGAEAISAFLRMRKVRRVHAYLAPMLIGAGGGLSWSRTFSVPSLNQAVRLERSYRRLVGDDIYWTARVGQ